MAATAGMRMMRVSRRQMTTFRNTPYRSSPSACSSSSSSPARLDCGDEGACAGCAESGCDVTVVSRQVAGTTPLSRDSVECFSSEARTMVINPDITAG